MTKNISLLRTFFTVAFVAIFLLLFVKVVDAAWSGCCAPIPPQRLSGTLWNGCCYSDTTNRNCCSLGDAIASGCEGTIPCANCQDDPLPCEDCNYGSCPAPLTDSGDAEFRLTNYRSCRKTGSCDDMMYGHCYEPSSEPPTSTIQILPSGNPTALGCTSITHTGVEINNPITMQATYSDPDSPAADIEAIYVWLKTETPTPNTPEYIDPAFPSAQSAQTYTNWSYGFMMHREGANWIPYIPSLVGGGNDKWVRANNGDWTFPIKGPSGQDMLTVQIVNIVPSGNTVAMTFNLDFRNIPEVNRVAEGAYNIFVLANDVFGFTPYDNYGSGVTKIGDYWNENQIRYPRNWSDSGRDWSLDFTNPEVSSPESTVSGPTNIKFGWSVQDAIGLYAVVGNIYVSDTVEKAENITEAVLTSTGVKTTINPYLPQRQGNTGDLRDGYIAKAINIGGITQNGSLNMNIGANREGSLIYHTTVFDNACNTNQSYSLFNLEDWIVTYGGLVYSSGGIEFSVKDVENPEIWNPVALLNKIKPSYADISSELYGTASTNPSSLKKSLLTKSFSISPFKGFKGVDYYKDVKNTFERREIGIPNITKMGNTVSLEGNLGIPDSSIKVLDRIGNLTVGTPSNAFTCNGKGIIFVSGNLTIENNILNSNRNSDACIFVVKGNVIINQGSNSSGGSIGYDEINAYILTNGTVTITGDSSLDGLYISGGIQSLGGINTIGRYLGLSYRDTHPVLVINHHSKYGIFSSELIGSPVDMVKIEVGFKPY